MVILVGLVPWQLAFAWHPRVSIEPARAGGRITLPG
jgi:hypothetical protein